MCMDKNQIFVISPIGKKDSDIYKKYDAILKTMIKPAIEEINKDFKIIRSDLISQPGSFIKDILEQLQNSYVVIANLTDLNPNVFYELGVRHALSNRTIMLTEDISSLPSDLKEYRVIEYSAELTSIETFKNELKKTFQEILANPDKSDNPVQDRLPGIIEKKEERYLNEIEILKSKLIEKSRKGSTKISSYISKRIERILELLNASEPSSSYVGKITWTTGSGAHKKELSIKSARGNFKLYYIMYNDEININYSMVISIRDINEFDLKEDLADIRVMLKNYGKKEMTFKYVIAVNKELSEIEKKNATNFFKRSLKLEGLIQKENQFELWDLIEINRVEKKLGLK
jgi:hypothetical protein